MTAYAGGLRYRLVCDSVVAVIRDSLAALGWFDAGRAHAPINLVDEPLGLQEEVPLNTLAVAPANSTSEAAEIGSDLEDVTHTFYADLYAENDSLGRHLAYDVADILKGKFPAIGRDEPNVQVFDFTQAPPVAAFFAEIQGVVVDKGVVATHPWQRYWWVVRFDVIDSYGSAG